MSPRLKRIAFAILLCGCGAKTTAGPVPPPAASAGAAAPLAVAVDASAVASETPPPSPPPTAAASVAPTPTPTSSVATIKGSEDSWARCHRTYKATMHDLAKDVAAMAKGCEGPTKMRPAGKVLMGKQADQDKPQSFPLEAKAHHCYRVYALASDGIRDLDLAVKDSAGVVVGQDSTDDPSPVVLEDGAVCFSQDDKASVVVSVGMGEGAYAVQIWEN